jgi:photosystem II stability/assembly factor-like uncharacterized protein
VLRNVVERAAPCEAGFVRRLALVAALLTVPSVALAHGGPPIVETLAFDPSDPMHVFAGTNFGTIVSHDGGASWTWICPSVVHLRTAVEDPIVAVSDMGALFVGDGSGLFRGSSDACDWSSVLAAPGLASAGAITRGGPGVLFAGSSSDGASNSVLRSTDDGRTWTSAYGPNLGQWYESIAVAPSDPMRVYAVQNTPPQRAEPWVVTVLRSDDGGAHWTTSPFTVLTHEWRLFLLGVDPTNEDRILAYTQDLYTGEHERVMLSEDGGASWTQVLQLTQVLGGAWAPDGSSAYVAGPVDGLWRSDDHGHTFAGIRTELYLRCVVADTHAVWVCADDYSAHFAIGRSTDRGVTFSTVARLRSISGMPSCAPTSALAMTCPADQNLLDMTLAIAPGGDAGVADDAATVDASTSSDAASTPPPAMHCGCTTGTQGGSLALVGVVIAVITYRRARTLSSRG